MNKFKLLVFQILDDKFDTQIIDFENQKAYSNYMIDLAKMNKRFILIYKDEQTKNDITYVIVRLLTNN